MEELYGLKAKEYDLANILGATKRKYINTKKFDESIDDIKKKMKEPVKYLEGRFEKIYVDQPFDYKKHKDNFPYYLEVIIMSDGQIKYAVPSHLDALMQFGKVTHEDCPKDREYDFLEWLFEITGCIAVWDGYYRGKANEKQISTLRSLKDYGIYHGDLINVDYTETA